MAGRNKIIALSVLTAVVFGAAAVIFFLFTHTSFAAPVVMRPNAAGANTGWTGAYTNVNETTPDEDATIDSTATPNAIQTYALDDLTRQGKIYSVKVYARAKATTVPETITFVVRTSAANYFSATAQTITTNWATYSYEWFKNPSTGGDWSITDINNLEAGYQFTGVGSGAHNVTQMYAEVTYKTELKKLVFHIAQRTTNLTPGQQTNNAFSIYIADEVDEVRSAFVEIKGVYTTSGAASMDISIDDASFSSGRQKNYTLPSSSIPRPFKILYDTTAHMNTITAPGSYAYTMNAQANNITVSVLSEKLIIVYTQIVPPAPVTGAYPASGTIISSTFDTGVADGASYNSIIWQGTMPADTKVRLQLATANADTGPWTFYGDTNGDGTCGTNEYYEPAPNAPSEITCRATHNNQRYFQYKIQMCSSLDCTNGGSATPQADDVIVNWSP